MTKIIETQPFVSKELGPQCGGCTHYQDEHNGPNDHCMHVLYTVVEPNVSFAPRKLCPCKKYEEK